MNVYDDWPSLARVARGEQTTCDPDEAREVLELLDKLLNPGNPSMPKSHQKTR